jgi:sporulation protein YlmC with PRC-barrel domain
MKRLLMTTAAASILAIGTAAYAQDSGTAQPPQQPQVVAPQPPANSNNATGGDTLANGTNAIGANTNDNSNAVNANSSVISGQVPAATASSTPANPPPSDAVISAQKDSEVRADQLIGMTVYTGNGEKVGVVHDILLDKNGKATGVVLNVGGVLGIGAKSVGLTWKEVDVQPDKRAVQVSYTKDQLEAAPTFKTTDQINAEMNAQTPPAPSGSGGLPAPQPGAGSMGGTATGGATQPTTNP